MAIGLGILDFEWLYLVRKSSRVPQLKRLIPAVWRSGSVGLWRSAIMNRHGNSRKCLRLVLAVKLWTFVSALNVPVADDLSYVSLDRNTIGCTLLASMYYTIIAVGRFVDSSC